MATKEDDEGNTRAASAVAAAADAPASNKKKGNKRAASAAAAVADAPASKKKKKNSISPPDKDKKKKLPNWTVAEDVILARSFVNTSQNPLVGNDQKGSNFWKTVHEKFNFLVDGDEDIENFGRDQDACMNRFQRQISKQVQKWNKYFKQLNEEKPSGTSKDKWPDLATDRFCEEEGYPFKFQGAALVLHAMPKFNPMVDVTELDDDDIEDDDEIEVSGDTKPAAVNIIGAPMGAHIKRPIGNKAAKREAANREQATKREHRSTANTQASIAAVANLSKTQSEMAGACGQIAAALDRKNKLLDGKNKLLDSKNKLQQQTQNNQTILNMVKIYMDMGEVAKAKELMESIKLSSIPEEIPEEQEEASSIPEDASIPEVITYGV